MKTCNWKEMTVFEIMNCNGGETKVVDTNKEWLLNIYKWLLGE